MKNILGVFVLAIAFVPMPARAQFSAAPEGGPPTKTTFVRLANNANAIIVEPLTPNPAKSRIRVIVTHPGHANNFNYFIGRELPKYGYRVMMLNYYGAEQTYDEFIAPIAAAIKALRVTPDYRLTENNVLGVTWRSTPNSIQGNLESIRVPTLVMSASCAQHLVFLEIAYDHSAAKDKELVGVEGANHMFQACRPEHGDTFRRAFDYVDSWLSKAGRF